MRSEGDVDFNDLGTRLRGEDENALVAELVHWPEVLPDQLEQIVGPMERGWIESRLEELQRRIQTAEEPIESLLTEKMALTNRMKALPRR
jgi:hypothetical protein